MALRPSADETVRLTIDLEPAGDPIAGRIRTSGGEEHAFTGYMGLIAALDALRPEVEVRSEDGSRPDRR